MRCLECYYLWGIAPLFLTSLRLRLFFFFIFVKEQQKETGSSWMGGMVLLFNV